MALGGQHREFLQWLLETCLDDGGDPDGVIAPETQDFLVERLSTRTPEIPLNRGEASFPRSVWINPPAAAATSAHPAETLGSDVERPIGRRRLHPDTGEVLADDPLGPVRIDVHGNTMKSPVAPLILSPGDAGSRPSRPGRKSTDTRSE